MSGTQPQFATVLESKYFRVARMKNKRSLTIGFGLARQLWTAEVHVDDRPVPYLDNFDVVGYGQPTISRNACPLTLLISLKRKFSDRLIFSSCRVKHSVSVESRLVRAEVVFYRYLVAGDNVGSGEYH